MLEQNPRAWEARKGLISPYGRQKRLDDAIDMASRVPGVQPQQTDLYTHLGFCFECQGLYLEQKRLDDAVALAEQAPAMPAQQADLHAYLGLGLEQAGALDRAIAAYRKAVELDRDHAAAHVALCAALALKRDPGWLDEALAVGRRAVELVPDHSSAHCNAGRVLLGFVGTESRLGFVGTESRLRATVQGGCRGVRRRICGPS